jgi:hypothetical protein
VTARAIACALLAAAACHPAPAPSTPASSPSTPAPPPLATTPPAATPPAPAPTAPARDLEAELGEQSRSVYACVEHELETRPMLQGHLAVDLDLERDGHVLAVNIPESTFPDDSTLRACVVTAWSAARVAPLPTRTTVHSALAWEPMCSAENSGGMRGSMDKEMIRHVIRSHLGEARVCYERQLAKEPTLQGRVLVQFTITGSGHVVASVVQDSTIDDPAVGDCIAGAVHRWRFPRPCGGGKVVVSYPFVLKLAPTAR